MIIKKEIYPKTQRVKCLGEKVYLTEKLDGSNLVFFKLNDKVYIAQRKNIIPLDEIEDNQSILYKGLYQWLNENEGSLKDIYEGSALCGEWLGMGAIKYSIDEFDKKYYIFAKARINEEYNLSNIQYDHNNLLYAFISQEIPNCMGIVPEVAELNVLPNKEHLDSIYDKYCAKVKRSVEGFVINYKNNINKYVRFKDGKLQEHHE